MLIRLIHLTLVTADPGEWAQRDLGRAEVGQRMGR